MAPVEHKFFWQGGLWDGHFTTSFNYIEHKTKMGGGNGMKSAMAKAKKGAETNKNAGGGASGMAARTGGDMNSAMAAAQAERAAVKAAREAKKAAGK